jgi:hypothetical protein
MNPLLMLLLGKLLSGGQANGQPGGQAPGGPAQAQGPKGVAQGRFGMQGPAAAQRSPVQRMMQAGVPNGTARRLNQAQAQPMPGPAPAIAEIFKHLSSMQGPRPGGAPAQAQKQGPLLSAMMKSPLMRRTVTNGVRPKRSASR